jgi:hypothetical protein
MPSNDERARCSVGIVVGAGKPCLSWCEDPYARGCGLFPLSGSAVIGVDFPNLGDGRKDEVFERGHASGLRGVCGTISHCPSNSGEDVAACSLSTFPVTSTPLLHPLGASQRNLGVSLSLGRVAKDEKKPWDELELGLRGEV